MSTTISSSGLPRHKPTSVTDEELAELMRAVEAAADAAAVVTRQYFRNHMTVSNKAGEGGFDPVTEADRLAELAIRDCLQERFPKIGFFGEEHDVVEGCSGLVWVVDPIDGTRAFMSGMPLWGTLIGLYDGRDVILGLMDQPILAERYMAYAGKATLATAKGINHLSTRAVHTLADATLYCTTPDMFEQGLAQKRFQSVKNAAQLTRYGGDCYAYALLAAGYVDIVLDCDLKPYDIQALIPIIQAAGGVVTNWQGESAVDGGFVVACGTQSMHEKVLPLLQAS